MKLDNMNIQSCENCGCVVDVKRLFDKLPEDENTSRSFSHYNDFAYFTCPVCKHKTQISWNGFWYRT